MFDPVIHRVPETILGSTKYLILLADFNPKACGPMYPRTNAGYLGKSVSSNTLTVAGDTTASSLLISTSRSPGTPTTNGSFFPSGWVSMTTTFFNVSAAFQSLSSLLKSFLELETSTKVSIVGVFGVSSA